MRQRKPITFSALIVIILLLSSCATTVKTEKIIVTRSEAFPDMYSEQPRSILVLPPINTSITPEATAYYMATIETPLSAAGYHMLPAESVSNTIKQKGLTDTQVLYTVPLKTLYEYFGSDAVLYTRIKQWEVADTGLISRLIISIESEIMSTKTSKQIWSYNRSINVDLNTVKTTGGSIQLLLESLSTDVDKATVDSLAYALRATTKLTQNLPFGPEHEGHLQDQEVELIGTIPEKIIQRSQADKPSQ